MVEGQAPGSAVTPAACRVILLDAESRQLPELVRIGRAKEGAHALRVCSIVEEHAAAGDLADRVQDTLFGPLPALGTPGRLPFCRRLLDLGAQSQDLAVLLQPAMQGVPDPEQRLVGHAEGRLTVLGLVGDQKTLVDESLQDHGARVWHLGP